MQDLWWASHERIARIASVVTLIASLGVANTLYFFVMAVLASLDQSRGWAMDEKGWSESALRSEYKQRLHRPRGWMDDRGEGGKRVRVQMQVHLARTLWIESRETVFIFFHD